MSTSTENAKSHVIIEPFHGGSHKQLIDGLIKSFYPSDSVLLLTLPAKKWKWYVEHFYRSFLLELCFKMLT